MNDDNNAKVVLIGLKLYPPTIRQDLLSSKFFGEYSSRLLEQWVHFGSDELSFLRKDIYNAFRTVMEREESCYVTDKSGVKWELSQVISSGEVSVRFENVDATFLISDCFGVHPDAEVRTEAFKSAARAGGMTSTKYHDWLGIISSRTLDDDEISLLLQQLSRSPVNVEKKIAEHMANGGIEFSTLVPDFDEYYVDLVGDVGEFNDIFSFAATEAHARFREILDLENEDGLRRILGFSSHSVLVENIDANSIEFSKLEKMFEWISENSDVLSKVGAIELAITYGECSPRIISATERMIEELRSSDTSQYGYLTEFCNLVLLVGGEFSRNRLFVSSPPFWRRLAIFSHAAILQRAVLASNSNVFGLSNSHSENRAPLFFLQTAIDLRLEPRWQSAYLGPEQLKAEFLGRIFTAANRHSSTINQSLRAYILDDPAIRNEVRFPFSYLPGPLEGGVDPVMTLPKDLATAIESALLSTPLELSSFVPLVNSALFFKLDGTEADLASKVLQTAKYQLRTGNNPGALEPILSGIATVAAVTRSSCLGDEVVVLMRALRNNFNDALNINGVITVGLIAAASRAEEQEWLDFVGRLFNEICFQELTQPDTRLVLFVLRQLCRLKPELWRTVGGAHAALQSIMPYGE